jgi:hypothetical protein
MMPIFLDCMVHIDSLLFKESCLGERAYLDIRLKIYSLHALSSVRVKIHLRGGNVSAGDSFICDLLFIR